MQVNCYFISNFHFLSSSSFFFFNWRCCWGVCDLCLFLPLFTGADFRPPNICSLVSHFPSKFSIVRSLCVLILFIIFELTCWELQIFEESAQQQERNDGKYGIGRENERTRPPPTFSEHFHRKNCEE